MIIGRDSTTRAGMPWRNVLWLLACGLATSGVCQEVHFVEASFDKSTFSSLTQLEARQECEDGLQELLQLAQQTIELSPEQRQTWITAGQLDIHRFFARYEQAKRSIPFGNVRRDQWQQVSNQAHASVSELSKQYKRGLHGESSLFDKTMQVLFDEPTVETWEQAREQSAISLYGEQIDAAILLIGRQVGLTPEQRMAIRQVMLANTRPAETFGASEMAVYCVLANMGEVEDELRGLFNDQSWRIVARLIEAGRTATR